MNEYIVRRSEVRFKRHLVCGLTRNTDHYISLTLGSMVSKVLPLRAFNHSPPICMANAHHCIFEIVLHVCDDARSDLIHSEQQAHTPKRQ